MDAARLTAAKSIHARIQIAADGTVWFSQSGRGADRPVRSKDGNLQELQLPGPNASPYAMNLDRDHDVWYSSEYLDEVGRLNTTTGKVVEYPFPHYEITSREYFLDAQGRMWYATPSNNKVGYFYLAKQVALRVWRFAFRVSRFAKRKRPDKSSGLFLCLAVGDSGLRTLKRTACDFRRPF